MAPKSFCPYLQSLLPPLLSSEASWDKIALEFHRQPPGELSDCSIQKHALCIKTGGYLGKAQRWLNEQFDSKGMEDGDVFVVPQGGSYRGQWDSPHDFIVLALEPSLIARIAYETINPEQVELLASFPRCDRLIYQIGLALKSALEIDRRGSRLYAEAMANALAVHLLKYYCTKSHSLRDYRGGLPQYKLREAIDYIEAHLDQHLSIANLAQLMQMSSHYFGRLFKQSTGNSPYQYIIQRRVERAKQLLLNDNLTLSQIAQSTGFAHQSHLNYHFKRLVGATPKQFQEK